MMSCKKECYGCHFETQKEIYEHDGQTEVYNINICDMD